MQATIYVTRDALDTALEMADLPYYERVTLTDEAATDPTHRAGYHLKSPKRMRLAALPTDATVVMRLTPDDAVFCLHVTAPRNLRGCLFEHAPNLPPKFAEAVEYWCGPALSPNNTGAVYYQSPENEYMVSITPTDWMETSDTGYPVIEDKLLSEGIIIAIQGLQAIAEILPITGFIEIQIPLDDEMVGIEADRFHSQHEYSLAPHLRRERIFIRVADILLSPTPDALYIELRQDWSEYGYFY